MALSGFKIWVLCGGNSSEREVSLRTGAGVCKALEELSSSVMLFDVQPGESLRALNWAQPPDLVYLALHGTFGEDGTIQGFLESLGVPYVGSGVQSSAVCFHKGLTKELVQRAGVPCPQSWEVVGSENWNHWIEKREESFFTKKWILKAARQGSTLGLERYSPEPSASWEQRKARLREQGARVQTFDSCLLVEEWVEGPELTVAVLEGRALPIVEIRPKSAFYDYRSKYTAGETEYLCPAPLSEDQTKLVQEYAEKAYAILECRDYARADFMLGAQGPRFLEINTLPGMTETSLVPKAAAASGLSYAAFVERVVRSALKRRGPQIL